ncbi:hypothetical protein Pla175_42020 [Pirellulimonas nuda]|uniref:Uncharacterized protein n=1 Tax=Pirellulimonas nuda TaxID=2528009 RepID=A0A518DH40_9BACT|nr:hypothetical protein [Pirellulimonas nuda]QDU90789.1 hypothetical protein Pla175_42020 [Pirellulimonas nuda]
MRSVNLLLLLALSAVMGAWAPAPALAQSPQRSVLQQLAGDISAQLDLRYPTSGGEKQAGRDRLAEAIDLWNASPKSDADAQVMERWLLDALRASMAGSKKPMPAPPEFSQKQIAAAPLAPEPIAEPTPITEPAPAPMPRSVASQVDPTPAPAPVTPQPALRPARPELPVVASNEHPAAARINWSDPFRDDPFRDDPVAVASAPIERPAQRQTRLKPELPPRPRGSVDLRELSARVRGLSQGLAAIDARLSDQRPPSAFELAGLVRDLEQLSSEDRFLRLYLNGLTTSEAREVGHRPDMRQTIDRLGDRVKQRQADLAEAQGEQSLAERDILTALAVKLDEIQNAGR